MTPKKRLGRGLDALLSKPVQADVESMTAEGDAAALRQIPVDLLSRGRYQPRTDMRQDSLEDLANSIRAQGIVQPIVARPLGETDGHVRYEIIAGERRWRAAQLAGLEEVPAIVRDMVRWRVTPLMIESVSMPERSNAITARRLSALALLPTKRWSPAPFALSSKGS